MGVEDENDSNMTPVDDENDSSMTPMPPLRYRNLRNSILGKKRTYRGQKKAYEKLQQKLIKDDGEQRFEAQVRLLGTMFEGTHFAHMTEEWVKTHTREHGGTEHMGFAKMTKDKLQVLSPYTCCSTCCNSSCWT